ncbi:MAG: DNA repair protein RecN [bacterium]
MLKQLFIKNFALLEELSVEFSPGFNVLTGETGTGKSLVVNALNSILGEKVSTDMLRSGADKAVVEGIFDTYSAGITRILSEHDIEPAHDELILRRELNQSGRSRTFINDCLAQMSVLKKVSDLLVDLHGQHEHQSLLRSENHQVYLDAYGGLFHLVEPVGRLYSDIMKAQQSLASLRTKAAALHEKQEFIQFQIKEIESLSLYTGEEEERIGEEKVLANHEKLVALCNEVYSLLYDRQEAAYAGIGTALERLNELAEIDKQFADMAQLLSSAYMNVEEVARFVNEYVSGAEYDQDRLENIRERLSQINRIKKKYALPVSEILEKLDSLKRDLSSIENLDSDLEELESQLLLKKNELSNCCVELSNLRKKAARGLEREIQEIIRQIGMENARLRIAFDHFDRENGGGILLDNGLVAKPVGVDRIAILASTNPGEDFKPLAQIASGGELSRIMLAIKSVLAGKDQIGVLVFDEIDIGISGRVAESVGRKLRDLSKSHQVICVTHLPQIASYADRHFTVRKLVTNGETFTTVQSLDRSERVKEIASLLGGEKVTDTVLKNAEEMLGANFG